ALWDELSHATTFIDIDDRAVEVLDDSAQALVIAAHALQHHPSLAKPREDLARAISHYDRRTWVDATAMARRLGVDGVLAAGLRTSDAGTRLATELARSGQRFRRDPSASGGCAAGGARCDAARPDGLDPRAPPPGPEGAV